MLYREIIAVCSEIHTKHINTQCGQNVEFANVKPGGTYSKHWALKFNLCFPPNVISRPLKPITRRPLIRENKSIPPIFITQYPSTGPVEHYVRDVALGLSQKPACISFLQVQQET
jgi:hypothetical protein